MQPLDVQLYREDHPIRTGITLLEASAGTGKTYSVTLLYLRMLLEKGFLPREIVVVTFTRAAAAELRERIHKRLADAEEELLLLQAGTTPDDMPRLASLAAILERATVDDPLAVIQEARATLDTGVISTIHRFAGRLSEEFAMATGTPSRSTLVEDTSPIIEEAARDLEYQLGEVWDNERREMAENINGFTSTITQIASALMDDPGMRPIPESVLKALAAAPLAEILYEVPDEVLASCRSFNDFLLYEIRRSGRAFVEHGADVHRAWIAAAKAAKSVNGNRYRFASALAALDLIVAAINRVLDAPDDDAAVLALDAITELGDKLKYVSESFIRERMKVTDAALSETPGANNIPMHTAWFDRIIAMESTRSLDFFKDIWLQRTALYVRQLVEERTARAGVRSFAHIIGDVVRALQGENRNTLIRAVNARYKAALIDEFQDTDRQQWTIFESLFSEAVTYLIGDPKQAIYGFRGANVAVYEQIRDGLPSDRIMTLGTNYRSDRIYNDTVNALFNNEHRETPCEGTPVADFVERYLNVASPERTTEKRVHTGAMPSGQTRNGDDACEYATGHASNDAAVVLRVMPASSAGRGRFGAAQNIAQEIAYFLSHEENAVFCDKHGWRAIAPDDCAVIVRSRREASIVMEALRAAGVPAVAREQESVTLSAAADGLLMWLSAIIAPASINRVRSFLTSPLVGLQLDELNALADDELTRWTEFFVDLKNNWWKSGFLYAIRRTLTTRLHLSTDDDVMAQLLQTPYGPRIAADLLHLAELVNAAQRDQRLSPAGVQGWLERLRAEHREGTGIAETFKRRVESDGGAVEVVTAHSSKGLEYNLVWLVGVTESKDNYRHFIHPDDPTIRFPALPALKSVVELKDRDDLLAPTAQTSDPSLAAHYQKNAHYQRALQWVEDALQWRFPSLTQSELAHVQHYADGPLFDARAMHEASLTSVIHEELRLLYVALTRARCRTVIYGRLFEKAAAALLLSPGHPVTKEPNAKDDAAIEHSNLGHGALKRTRFWPPGTLNIERWTLEPTSVEPLVYQAPSPVASVDALEVQPAPDVQRTRHLLQSFSSLSGHFRDHFSHFRTEEGDSAAASELEASTVATPDEAPPRLRLVDAEDDNDPLDLIAPVTPLQEALPLARFASGKDAGTALHQVFEDVDFFPAATDATLPVFRTSLDGFVQQALSSLGLPLTPNREALVEGVEAVVRTPLGGVLAHLRLADIQRTDRLDELEFFLPMGHLDTATTTDAIFAALLAREGDPAIAASWFDDVRHPVKAHAALHGMLTGFIDLVFRAEVDGVSQYFIVDYKSNRIVPSGEPILAEAFTQEALKREMGLHHYYLQYHLYTLALHRWLKTRLPDYDYDRHIGGSYYLFVRGMTGADTPVIDGYARGVFFDRPPRAVIEAMDAAFSGFASTEGATV